MEKSLPRSNRITRKKDISRVLRTGHGWECPLFRITYLENREKDRLAILVSRKNGNAVRRNEIKRTIREVFRNNKKDTPPYRDILIIPQGTKFLEKKTIERYFVQWQTNNGKKQDI